MAVNKRVLTTNIPEIHIPKVLDQIKRSLGNIVHYELNDYRCDITLKNYITGKTDIKNHHV